MTISLKNPQAMLQSAKLTLAADLSAGLTTAMVAIPDGMASAILAGLNPIHGLYAPMIGTPMAALTLGSQFMNVTTTGAMSVVVGSALVDYPGEQKIQGLIALTVMVGLFQLLLGLLKLGNLMRFVSNAVLVGFLTGVGVIIILGQLGDFTGYQSQYHNKVIQAVDLLFHPGQIHLPTLGVGLITLALIFLLERTRAGKYAMVLAMAAGVVVVRLLGWGEVVPLVGGVADIPRALPRLALPDVSLLAALLGPAMAVGLIGLVQASGVSKSVPNADGSYADISRDFIGQGLANAAAGLFRGMPIGGSISATAVNLNAGAKSRWANVFSGLFMAIIVLAFSDVVERFPMASIAALLIVAGFGAIKLDPLLDVWKTGPAPRLIMLVTLGATLTMPVQWAVLFGVILSMVQYVYQSSLDIRLVEVVPQPDGRFSERPAPAELPAHTMTLLHIYGSVFYAGAAILEQMLPSAQHASGAVVILRLRGREEIGSTFIKLLEQYSRILHSQGGRLILTGVSERVCDQIERVKVTEISREDIFLASDTWGEATQAAIAAAQSWLQRQ